MRILDPAALEILRHPGTFAWRTLRAFRANQGLLLAGAVAYYALLSIVPLLILAVIQLSRLIDRRSLRLSAATSNGSSRPSVSISASSPTPFHLARWLLFAT